MIQNPTKEVTLVVYDNPKPPRYYTLNKSILRFFFTIIPLLTLSSVLFSLFYSVFLKNKITSLQSSEPAIIRELKQEKLELQETIAQLHNNTKLLESKIEKGSAEPGATAMFEFFNIPLGFKDLRRSKLIKVEEIKHEFKNNREFLTFNLVNNDTRGIKLSGYIHIYRHEGSSMDFYPRYTLNKTNFKTQFSEGESFGFTRFRKTKADFKSNNEKGEVFYRVFIFSRSGDLISLQKLGPFTK